MGAPREEDRLHLCLFRYHSRGLAADGHRRRPCVGICCFSCCSRRHCTFSSKDLCAVSPAIGRGAACLEELRGAHRSQGNVEGLLWGVYGPAFLFAEREICGNAFATSFDNIYNSRRQIREQGCPREPRDPANCPGTARRLDSAEAIERRGSPRYRGAKRCARGGPVQGSLATAAGGNRRVQDLNMWCGRGERRMRRTRRSHLEGRAAPGGGPFPVGGAETA